MDARIQFALAAIRRHTDLAKFDMSEMSTLIGVSEARLLRLFRRETGKPLRAYLREIKMERAVLLIKQGHLSIKQVSAECGYTDASNFNRDFRIVYGISAQRFRLREIEALSRRAAAGE